MNKVKYNLKNVHYAPCVLDAQRKPTYGTPVPWPGAVNLSLDAQGGTNPFYADGIKYFVSSANNGYSGTFESALIPESFREDIMGDVRDSNGILIEDADAKPKNFALLFEFDGDDKAMRHAMYNCVATRPSVASQTKEDSITPVTETLNIEISPVWSEELNMNIVKGKSSDETDAQTYAKWYDTVYLPLSASLGSLTVTSVAGTNTGDTKITVAESLGSNNSYVYKVANNASSVALGQDLSSWTAWDGSADITATSGKTITVAEVDSDTKAVKAGSATVVSA